MDLLTQADLELLARREQPGTHVSLFIPTHRSGSGVPGDRIRWKNLLAGAEQALAGGRLRRPEIDELLAPARALEGDSLAWQYMSDGLAVFLRPGWRRLFRVPLALPELATVGERFVVGPLLRLLTDDAHFLVLALSRRRVRLLEGSLQRVEELELGELPTSLRESVEPPGPRSAALAFSTSPGGRAGPAVFYGHGAADEDVKADEARRFLRQLAGGLHEYLGDQGLPMLLVGLDELRSLYRELNTYPQLLDAEVRQNPDQLSAEQLHGAVWPLVEEWSARRRGEDVARFEQLHGTGRAITDASEIERAALAGRVETLFLAAEPWCWERVESGAAVRLGADPAFSHCELLDEAAMDALARGGHVYALAAARAPGGGDVAAVLRY